MTIENVGSGFINISRYITIWPSGRESVHGYRFNHLILTVTDRTGKRVQAIARTQTDEPADVAAPTRCELEVLQPGAFFGFVVDLREEYGLRPGVYTVKAELASHDRDWFARLPRAEVDRIPAGIDSVFTGVVRSVPVAVEIH